MNGADYSGSCLDKDQKFVGLALAASVSRAIICKATWIIKRLVLMLAPLTRIYLTMLKR